MVRVLGRGGRLASMKKVDLSIKPLFTNNDRRRAGLRPRRKRSKGRRYKTRCAAWEDFCAWYDWISAN